MSRPDIPADIRRAVLVEAGHRCAIPRCNHTELDVHHIVPWADCQKHEYSIGMIIWKNGRNIFITGQQGFLGTTKLPAVMSG